MSIDLNADMGESFGRYTLGNDEALLRCITSANLACGFHAGDPTVIRRTIRAARSAGVAVGAHPSFPDLQGFGRRQMKVPASELEDMVLYQIADVAGIAAAEGVQLHHVKAHGALGNMAHKEPAIAGAIVRAVAAFDRTLVLYATYGLELMKAGLAAGLTVAAEAFADRAYEPDGSLVLRSHPDAVIHDPARVIARVARIVRDGEIEAIDGTVLKVRVDTICTHGDTPGAHELTRRIREGLEGLGIKVMPFAAVPA
jgi:UPF0271 protein